jgi:hypothetical protein
MNPFKDIRLHSDHTRKDVACATIWSTTKTLMEYANQDKRYFAHGYMAVLVFCAFTFEAYLNDVGLEIADNGNAYERMGPLDKYEFVLNHIGLKTNFGAEPDQVLKNLFSFRDNIVHGKSEETEIEKHNISEIRAQNIRNTPPEWLTFCDIKNAKKAMKVIEERTNFIDEKLGRSLPTLSISGWYEGCDTLIE